MEELKIKPVYWMTLAEDLFLEEFEAPEAFYSKFFPVGPAVLYHELASRVAEPELGKSQDMTAYRLMYGAYMTDVQNNNHKELDELVRRYKELQQIERAAGFDF
jgi:dihydroxyacetone kinase DhaKLM complex PTS-EIIA-like component DhaM